MNATETVKYAEAKVAEWEAKGNAAIPGSAYRVECFRQAEKWLTTALAARGE